MTATCSSCESMAIVWDSGSFIEAGSVIVIIAAHYYTPMPSM